VRAGVRVTRGQLFGYRTVACSSLVLISLLLTACEGPPPTAVDVGPQYGTQPAKVALCHLDCGFRLMWATDSEPSGPPVPAHVGH